MSAAPPPVGWRRWGGPAAIAFATVLMVWRSWLKWPDLLVDYGQQLYVAWRLAAGEVLYRDIAYFHGPLSSYLHAGVMNLWGTGMLSLVVFNLLLVSGFLALLYRLLSELGGRLAATAGCLVFVGIFAFGQYLPIGNYNFVCAYTYEITHGLMLALAAIYSFERHRQRPTSGSLVVSGLLLGLVFLTKVEVFVAAATALTGGCLALGWRDRLGASAISRNLGLLAGSALVAPALAWLALCVSMSPAAALSGVTRALVAAWSSSAVDLAFYRSRMGLDDPAGNLWRLALTSVWHLAVLAPAVAGAFLWQKRPKLRWLAGIVAAVPIAWLAFNLNEAAWFQAARPLPLWMILLAAASLASLWRGRRARRDGPEASVESTPGRSIAAALPLTLFALTLLLKIALNSRVYHYGFALAMPATLLLTLIWLQWLPRWISRLGGKGGLFRLAAAAILLLATSAHVLRNERFFATKTYLVGNGADAFWSDARGQAVDLLLTDLASRRQPGDTLTVFPDGILLNYLARMPTSLPYLNYVPTEVLAYGEEKIRLDLMTNPPDWIVLVEKSTAEFGYRYFGQDYAVELRRSIDQTYLPVSTVGAVPLTGQGFGLQLWQKRPTDQLPAR